MKLQKKITKTIGVILLVVFLTSPLTLGEYLNHIKLPMTIFNIVIVLGFLTGIAALAFWLIKEDENIEL